MTWPPPRPEEEGIEGRPWDPGHRRERSLHKESDRLVYVVVDEMVENWVGLSLAPWPLADDAGRLRFPGGDPIEVGTSKKALESFLATEDRGKEAARRRRSRDNAPTGEADQINVRIGLTFGARVKRGRAQSLLERLSDHASHGEVRIDDLNKILRRPVDLTDKGRLLAKLATYGAVLSTLPREAEDGWQLGDEIEA